MADVTLTREEGLAIRDALLAWADDGFIVSRGVRVIDLADRIDKAT